MDGHQKRMYDIYFYKAVVVGYAYGYNTLSWTLLQIFQCKVHLQYRHWNVKSMLKPENGYSPKRTNEDEQWTSQETKEQNSWNHYKNTQ